MVGDSRNSFFAASGTLIQGSQFGAASLTTLHPALIPPLEWHRDRVATNEEFTDMKRFLLAAAAAAVAAVAPAFAGDVSVSIGFNQPGLYGQINIGDQPRPQVIYAQPVVIQAPPVALAMAPEPIYLHVPPGHERHWRKHCAEYDACGRPVYFVSHDWYQREYAPRHNHDDYAHGDDRHRDRGDEHDHGRHRGHDHEGDGGHD